MSFIQSTLKCDDCGYEMNVAFGINGMTVIAQHPERCANCNSLRIKKISDGWNAENNEAPLKVKKDKK